MKEKKNKQTLHHIHKTHNCEIIETVDEIRVEISENNFKTFFYLLIFITCISVLLVCM